MRLLALNCNQCGAPLDVPAKARFVTCSFCNVRLQVQHQGSAVYTETLEDIAEDVREIKHTLDVEQLDRAWEREREGFMIATKNGQRVLPTRGGSILGAVAMSVFGVIWLSAAGSSGAAAPFLLLGVLIPAVGVYACIRAVGKAKEYEQAHEHYLERRKRLVERD